jgi:hypothetical protein
VAQIIPLTNAPNQQLSVALNVDGAVLRLNLAITFSEMAQYWLMSISDAQNNLLLSSVPLITGAWPAANLLAQQAYMKIGSAYVINLGMVADDYPTDTELGTGFLLLWDDTAS